AQQRPNQLWGDAETDSGYDEGEDNGEQEQPDDPESAAPRLLPGPREGPRDTVQARALLEKAERLVVAAPPEDKPELERLMTAVRNALADRRWDELARACDELSDGLFYLGDE